MKNINIRKTKDQFINESVGVHGDVYNYDDVIYISNKKKVSIFCKTHGLFTQTPKSHLIGQGCPSCSKIKLSISRTTPFDKVISKFHEKHGDKYSYDLVRYINMHTNVDIVCKKHGIFSVKPSDHLKYGCKRCYFDIIGKCLLKSTEQFIIDASKKHNNFYDYSQVNYINNHKKVIIICKKHGEFKQNPSNHLVGSGCPSCKRSKGEVKVESFLIDNGLKYIQQHTFNDCRNINTLPFDFYLPDYNICIEYDGKQHFAEDDKRSIYYSSDTKTNDNIKNKYCLDNNINLIRIPYNEFNKVEKILFKEMSQYKKITQVEKNDRFISKAREIFGYKYDYSKVNYIDSHTSLIIIYNGKEFKQTPIKHLQGKKVENTIKKMSTDEFVKKSKKVWGDDRFNYSKCEYMGINSHIILFDNLKNKWIEQTAKSHLNGLEVIRHTKEEFIDMCNLIYDNKYNYDNMEYNSLASRITIQCPEHGDFILKAASHLLAQSHCTTCKDFIGEKEIAKFLSKYDINYDRQHKFPDCKNIYQLPFDFYIPSMRTCIEFDGEQHFLPLSFFGGQVALDKLKTNDKIKSDYCEDNYISLIRIRYDQIDDIYRILWDNLKTHIKTKKTS